MALEEIRFTADEESRIVRMTAAVQDPNKEFFDDGIGGYLSMNDIVAKIREGTPEGREFLQLIMDLPESSLNPVPNQLP